MGKSPFSVWVEQSILGKPEKSDYQHQQESKRQKEQYQQCPAYFSPSREPRNPIISCGIASSGDCTDWEGTALSSSRSTRRRVASNSLCCSVARIARTRKALFWPSGTLCKISHAFRPEHAPPERRLQTARYPGVPVLWFHRYTGSCRAPSCGR